MKIFSVAKLTCLLALTSQMIFADNEGRPNSLKYYEHKGLYKLSKENVGVIAKGGTHGKRFATAAFENDLYEVDVPSTSMGATLLSKKRNYFEKWGAIVPTDSGVKILRRGDYWVDFSTFFQNISGGSSSYRVILKRSKDFDLSNPLNVKDLSFYNNNEAKTIDASGILKDVKPGTELSLVVQGVPNVGKILVLEWKISVFKIREG